MGMKSSCCGKCSNPDCIDYGECTCFDSFMEQRLEFMKKMLKDGKFPVFDND